MGYHPHSLQAQILANRSRFRLVVAGRRWGKSLSAAWEALHEALMGGRVWVVGLTYEQTDRILEPIWGFLTPRRGLLADGTRRSDRRIVLPGGGFIVGKSADHPDSLVGESLTLVVLDEAPIMPERVWSQMLRPCLSDRRGRALFIGTPRGHNWIFDRYSSSRRDDTDGRGEADWYAWRAPSWTNDVMFPGGEDDPEIKSARHEADACGMLPLFDQEWGASFTALQGRVYQAFDSRKHILADNAAAARCYRFIGGVDYGAANPSALLVWGQTNDGGVRCVDEWFQRNKTHDEIVDAMFALDRKWNVKQWWSDHEPALIRAAVQRGINIENAYKEVTEGCMIVARKMAQPNGFGIARRCRNLLREIETYVWRETQQRGVVDEPVKRDDHACLAADSMVLTSRGSVPIVDVCQGMLVATQGGWKPVTASGMTKRAASTLRVVLSNGQTLTGTSNHPVWMEGRGWTRLDNLKAGDALMGRPCASFITESGITDTPSRGGARCASIGRRTSTTRCAASVGCTRKSGRNHTDRSPLAATSTTRMKTRSTTHRTTLNACPPQSTEATMDARGGTGQAQRSAGRQRQRPENAPRNGTIRKQAASGTGCTASNHGLIVNQTHATVTSAVGCICLAVTRAVTAPTGAEQRQDANAETTTSSARVQSAIRCSRSIDTSAPSLVPVYVVAVYASSEQQPVYNLTVDGAHEFFAAGVLVHNCDAMRYAIATEERASSRVLRSTRIRGL